MANVPSGYAITQLMLGAIPSVGFKSISSKCSWFSSATAPAT
jgi:hypothetical protein